MAYREDYDWQLKFLEPIRNIAGPLLLQPASFDLDTKEATDLLVLTARDMRIGCRVRRAGYADRYPWEFTIRSRRDSGAKTELAKITDGWGDWLFYGHAGHDALPSLAKWFIIDLHHWRAHMIRNRDTICKGEKANDDGTYFAWFDLRSFPSDPPILVASSHEVPMDHIGDATFPPVDGAIAASISLPEAAPGQALGLVVPAPANSLVRRRA